MHKLISVAVGACIAGAVFVPTAATASDVDQWETVPEQTLRDLRGGVDLKQSGLVADFTIDRVVEVDGQVVARMQIVISNLDRLGSGGLPTISISGATAELVQIMNASGLSISAPTLVSAPAQAAPQPTLVSAPAQAAPQPTLTASSAAPAASATGAAATAAAPSTTDHGSIANNNTQSGSMAQFGSALTSAMNAVGAATSATGAANSSSGSASTPSGASAVGNSPLSANSATPPSAAQSSAPASTPSAASAAASSAGSSAGTPNVSASTAPLIVVSNLPNATAITTAVQNDVRAATIQVQTTITATLNSLSALNALSLANAIRSQVTASIASSH